jgi:CheY-specific phosphatase CheX
VFESIRNAALSAMLHIFETLFFILLDPVEGKDLPDRASLPDPFLKSEIPFEGNFSGSLSLLVPYSLSEMLAQNFMGFEEEVNESQILDVSGELANMICGNLFSVLDKNSVYVLGTPATQKISPSDGPGPLEKADLTLEFMAEDQPVILQIQFKPKAA